MYNSCNFNNMSTRDIVIIYYVLCTIAQISCHSIGPRIEIQPIEDVKILDGGDAEFHCNVKTAIPHLIRWVRDGFDFTERRYSTDSNGFLRIQRVSLDDAGTYTCVVSSEYVQATLESELIVIEKTRIIEDPEDFEAIVGAPAWFHCEVYSDRRVDLKIQWMHNNEPIDFDREIRLSIKKDHTLHINALIDLDFGTYECVASTPFDRVTSSSAELMVMDIPEPPEIEDITCDPASTTIQWRGVGINRWKIQNHTVIYSINMRPEIWITSCQNVPVIYNSCSIVLKPGGDYKFRVIATNSVGQSLPSKASKVCSA